MFTVNRDLWGRGTNLSAPSGHFSGACRPVLAETATKFPAKLSTGQFSGRSNPLKGEARLLPAGVAFLAPPLGELARSA